MSGAGIRRRLAGIWLLVAAVVAVIVILDHRDLVRSRSMPAVSTDARMLVPVPVDDLGAIEVAEAGTLHRFERDLATGAWFYHGTHAAAEPAHAHGVDPAAAARIEQALRAFGRTRIEREVGRSTSAERYGVTTPRMVILVYRPNQSQPLAQYAVGELAPDTVSRYVEVVGGAGVVTIPSYQVDNLATLIDAAKTGRLVSDASPPRAPGR